MPPVKADQRREVGLRTRARLLDAALDLLAERGEDGVTLRELTDAAGANVAAVGYHFGSLKSLCGEEIGRAAGRGRGEMSVVAGSFKKKKKEKIDSSVQTIKKRL